MKKAQILTTVFVLLYSMACEEPLDNYVHLEYSDFMKLSNDEIADSLATILNVAPVAYNQNVSNGMLFSYYIKWDVRKGYEYIANDSAKITVWVDQEDNPCYVAYELERWGTSKDWSYAEDSVISEFKSSIEKAGGDLVGSHDLTLNKYAGRDDHWYELYLTQTYHDTAIGFPYFYSETESDTSKVNFLVISRWYTNLDDIRDILSDQALKGKAREYFENSEEVDSIPEELTVEGYYIIKDKLSRQVGSAVIDEWGSTLDLYIDVQNGELVGESALYVD
jgi:hypothetical protein